MHGTSSLTNRTQPSFLTSNPPKQQLNKSTSSSLYSLPEHTNPPLGVRPLCARATGRGKRASAFTGRERVALRLFHPSGKWSFVATPTEGREAERVFVLAVRPLQCACAVPVAGLGAFCLALRCSHYRASVAPRLPKGCTRKPLGAGVCAWPCMPQTHRAPAPLLPAWSRLPSAAARGLFIFGARALDQQHLGRAPPPVPSCARHLFATQLPPHRCESLDTAHGGAAGTVAPGRRRGGGGGREHPVSSPVCESLPSECCSADQGFFNSRRPAAAQHPRTSHASTVCPLRGPHSAQ